jgi:DNA-binding transcriptional LysR family regulator
VTLTDAGADFLVRLEPILAALEEAEHAVRGTGELRGVLRVGLSTTFAIPEVVPRLPMFLEKHPALRIELLVDDQRQDLVGQGVDVALRLGSLPDSTAMARRIGEWPRLLAASPAYLAHAGEPRAPTDLAAHAVILGPVRPQRAWSFRKDGKATSVRVDGRLTATVNEVSTAAAVAGLGIVAMPLVGCRKELEDGTLVRVLPDWDLGSVEMHAVFAAGRATKPSARALTEFLMGEFVN